MRSKQVSLVPAAVAVAALMASSADAGMFTFSCITFNNPADCAAGEAQLSMDVLPGPGAGQVSFTFSNSGPVALSITDVYFDDGTLLGIALITNGPGVNFSQGASPGNLPGGNSLTPAFVSTTGFNADSNPPTQPNGVNPGESLTITFDLIAGFTFGDTITALNTPGDVLRVGLHVQGFNGGGSEAFVNVPAPGAFALAGFAGIAAARRRR